MAKLAEKKQKQYRTMFDVNNIPGRRYMYEHDIRVNACRLAPKITFTTSRHQINAIYDLKMFNRKTRLFILGQKTKFLYKKVCIGVFATGNC